MIPSDPAAKPDLLAEKKLKRRRPAGVFLLCFVILVNAFFSFLRVNLALERWHFLNDVMPFTPLFQVLSGAFWGVFSLITAALLWIGGSGSRRLLFLFILLFSLFFWIDRLFLPGYPGRNTNWIFIAIVNFSVFACPLWLVYGSKARKYFEIEN